jgi:putative aminopeptidase FrvX
MMVAYIKECEQEELENNVMVLFSSEQEEIGDIRRKIMNCFNRRGIGVVFSELSSYTDPVFHALEEVMSIRKNKDVFIGILIGNDNYNAHIVNLLSDIAKLNN